MCAILDFLYFYLCIGSTVTLLGVMKDTYPYVSRREKDHNIQAVENIIFFHLHYFHRQITKGITVWSAGEKLQAMLALWGQLTPAISGILSLLPTYSWKSLQGCQPKVSSSLCPPLSNVESLFHADHITEVFNFKLSLNDLSSFANTESNDRFAYSRPADLPAPSRGQTVKRIPTAYHGKAGKTPLFLGKTTS